MEKIIVFCVCSYIYNQKGHFYFYRKDMSGTFFRKSIYVTGNVISNERVLEEGK